MINKGEYFCNCRKPIEKDETWCIDCEAYSKSRYFEEESEQYLTDELKHKYIKD